MNWQSGLALKFLNIVIKNYGGFRRLIKSLISWSPFLINTFDTVLRVGKFSRFVSPNPTNIEAHVMFYPPGDTSLISQLRLGIFEPEVKKTIIQLLRPGMTMIDAGANIGYFTLLAARAVGPQGHVYAFEPVPSTVELLKKNVEVNGYSDRVTVMPKAITDKGSQVRIFWNDGDSTSSNMFGIGREKNFVETEGVSLDEFFSNQGWPPIHVIKMDLEGAEKLALDGMRGLSHKNPGLKLIVEVNLVCSVEELTDALFACGFSRFCVLEHSSRIVNILEYLRRIAPQIQTQQSPVNLLCENGNWDFAYCHESVSTVNYRY